jgi:hypothetical protein
VIADEHSAKGVSISSDTSNDESSSEVGGAWAPLVPDWRQLRKMVDNSTLALTPLAKNLYVSTLNLSLLPQLMICYQYGYTATYKAWWLILLEELWCMYCLCLTFGDASCGPINLVGEQYHHILVEKGI